MKKYKISEEQLQLLINAINCDEDEYRGAKFNKEDKIIEISGLYGCSDYNIQLE